jgi:hypothetical protein
LTRPARADTLSTGFAVAGLAGTSRVGSLLIDRRSLLWLAACSTVLGCTRRPRLASRRSRTEAALVALADAIAPGGGAAPSATQAGAADYLVRCFRRAPEAERRRVAGGLRALAPRAQDGRPQDAKALARALEKADPGLFEWVRRRVFEGLYADPRHGANRGALAWRWLGFP